MSKVSAIRKREFKTQYGLSFEGEINGDLFAGGGGASTGYELGTDQPVHFAINHNPDAISQHEANHPGTRHFISDVFEVDPRQVIAEFDGRPIGHLHASPDCTHHSQAAGGQPRKKAIRSLAWVIHKWAGRVRPRIITMENVEQMMHWSPLVAKRCPKTGRVIKLDRTVAAPGERVPVQDQYLVPDKRRKGHNWQHFIQGLRAMGYKVQWRTLRACDYGAGTTRERLFLIARCDGQPITWPKPTHAQHPKAGQKKWLTAADSIDWRIPVPSIFTRKRPLADNTLRRIAKGIHKFVLTEADPFIVPIANYGSSDSVHSVNEPLRTITAWPKGGTFAVVTAFMATLRNNCVGRSANDPLPTITAGAEHHALVECTLSPEQEAGALRVAAFLMHYYSEGGQWGDLRKPMGTITTKDRLALVTVTIKGQPFVIVDIGLRMLTPRELYNAQGFPPNYVIDRGADGRRFSKAKQVLFVGNSVSPPPMAELCREIHRPVQIQQHAAGGN